MSDYYFGGDQAAEQRRLTAIEVYADPASKSVLLELGVGSGWNCWEVGAGAGSMVYWLADKVGPDGQVLATDLDIGGLEPHSNVEIVRHDVANDDLPETRFDLIHARFLLEHLPKPDHVLRRLASALQPGGLLVIEDADGLDLTMYPGIAELTEICQAWERAASSVSWNPSLGRHLVTALSECDLREIQGVSYRRRAPGGPIWETTKLGLTRLHDLVVEQGASRQALAMTLRALDDPGYAITGAPVTIAWGAKNH